jgi:EmrB/QacA subfamily drug resistance transporter
MTRQANPWAALGALCIGFFMILLDTTIVSIAIPAMVRGLNTDLNSVVWVISMYLLTYAVPMLFTSRLGDRFGPKRIFLAGLVVFTLASLWCGLSGTAGTLIAARAVQGLGAALMTPQTLAFITHLFPPAKRGPAMGLWGGVAGLATIAGPLLGGVLVDGLGWEWIFFVNVPIGLIGIVLTVLLVPDWQPKHSHSFDVLGILLSAAGLFCLVFGIQNGQHYGWGRVAGPVNVFEIIGAGLLLMAVFLVWQRFNRREPLLPLRIFRNRNFSTGAVTAAAIGFAMTGMFVPLVIYIQDVLGMSPTMGGVLTAPMSLLSGIVAPFIGRMSDRVNAKYLVMVGFVALAVGLGIVALQARADTNPWTLVPALLVCGLGTGFVFAPMSNVAMSSVEATLAGAASGIFNTARQVGGVLGSAAIGVLLQARITASMAAEHGNAPPALTAAARQTLLLPVAVLLVGAIAALAMQRVAPRPPTPVVNAEHEPAAA